MASRGTRPDHLRPAISLVSSLGTYSRWVTADENYRGLTRFMAQAKHRLRPGGRILLNFGTSGDIDYLYSLIERAGLFKEVTPYGEATRDGMTVRYYRIRLTA